MSPNAVEVLKSRYLLRDVKGRAVESPLELFHRVAHAISSADTRFGKDSRESERRFFEMLSNLEFLPNSPTLMNAGTSLGQLSACFVLPVGDSLKEIFDSVNRMALIHQSGGGTGFSFSRLRPSGDRVKSTAGVASGPVSFMRVFDTATDVIKQGGRRRGANMGVLRVDHPDILSFIRAKSSLHRFENFNISVAVTDAFMRAVEAGGSYWLVNPRDGRRTGRLEARAVFNALIDSAWRSGDPGIIFIDEVNRHNPTPQAGRIESTNPCGEAPLLPWESCNLGSINLNAVVRDGRVDWDGLKSLVWSAVHFLDNVIELNKYPFRQIEQATKSNRKIGLGVMGFADLLVRLGIPYDSKDALKTADKLMGFVSREARQASVQLAASRGSFPNFPNSVWARRFKRVRNATVTSVAPTGTISIIAGCSSGIEPLFALAYQRKVSGGKSLVEANPLFEQVAREQGFYSKAVMARVARTGTLSGVRGVPSDVKRMFRTALEISPEWHVRMQAAFQRHVDNAVSKTVNLPHNATRQDVRKVFMLAWKERCKGVTVYRYGSKKEQVLSIGVYD